MKAKLAGAAGAIAVASACGIASSWRGTEDAERDGLRDALDRLLPPVRQSVIAAGAGA